MDYLATKDPCIRYANVIDKDPIFGGEYEEMRFEVFKRPYFFGLLGKKRWEFIIQTNCYATGMSFCGYILHK